jgi:hypothetical protein
MPIQIGKIFQKTQVPTRLETNSVESANENSGKFFFHHRDDTMEVAENFNKNM